MPFTSLLPSMLDSGQADAIMVSSIHALVNPGSRVAACLSIGSQDEVLSVRLFSKVPIRQIKSLATDLSSMTSNALARIVLAEQYGVHPVSAPQPPSLDAMLRDHDACLMIGDNGMAAEANGLALLDLGREWRELTGLPFVWALWVGRRATGLRGWFPICRMRDGREPPKLGPSRTGCRRGDRVSVTSSADTI